MGQLSAGLTLTKDDGVAPHGMTIVHLRRPIVSEVEGSGLDAGTKLPRACWKQEDQRHLRPWLARRRSLGCGGGLGSSARLRGAASRLPRPLGSRSEWMGIRRLPLLEMEREKHVGGHHFHPGTMRISISTLIRWDSARPALIAPTKTDPLSALNLHPSFDHSTFNVQVEPFPRSTAI